VADGEGAERLGALREALGSLDSEILELISRRQEIVTDIGRIKSRAGKPVRDFGQEKEVVDRARRSASRLGLTAGLAEDLMLLLIRASLTAQEQDRVHASSGGSGRRVLIIGGAGKMGGWLARFLSSQGFAVEVADPAPPAGEFRHVTDWQASELDHDILIVATPLSISCRVLEGLAERRPAGVVFDIGSLKTPLRPGLQALVRSGVRATSIHPMFGPDTEMLSGRHVIFVDLGVEEATQEVRSLFGPTMAVQVEMDLESHDRLIAYILGLSHALNIAFFTALAESGETAPRLARLSSTTFDAQMEIARRVAGDNPHLYYEIQSLNDYGDEALSALESAVGRVRSVVSGRDAESFVGMMMQGRRYLEGSRSGPGGRTEGGGQRKADRRKEEGG
jgi:chorismate mutase/prephenate dehydrogenase